MIVALFVLALVGTVVVINKKNEAQATEEALEFDKKDSMLIFGCFLSSIVLQMLLPKLPIPDDFDLPFSLLCGGFYLMVLVLVNMSREKKIQRQHEQIVKIFQSMVEILGNVPIDQIDFANVPFKFEEDQKTGMVCQVVVDTTKPGLRINDNSIIYATYSLNKYFPEFQWTNELDAPNCQLMYRGLPKPPTIAKWPGSDYRPASWIPVGIAGGNVEVCLNLTDEKPVGMSSFVDEDGRQAGTMKLPSAPQTMVLGSTGGGKAIAVDQIVQVVA